MALQTPGRGCTTLGSMDVLVFERTVSGFALIGGSGRGSGWAGIVEIADGDASLVDRSWRRGAPVRAESPEAVQIVGPYHARHAVAVPVGERHVVVFGADRPVELMDADAVRLAAAAVDDAKGVPADKLLADELELVHAVRDLMAYRPETVRDTLHHIATVAASALSCDVAIIRLQQQGAVPVTEAVARGSRTAAPLEPEIDLYLAGATDADEPILDQANVPARTMYGVALASHLTLPIGVGPRIGALALGHAADRPRGFTSLCQRIGRAVAEAAELLISQAIAREELAAERDLLARMSQTDPLTGAANRRRWDDEVARYAASPDPLVGSVLTCDIDGLKAVNDRYGHVAGDALIRAASNLLSSSVRDRDVVTRMGGDEFAVLLNGADLTVAIAVRRRMRRAERLWRITEFGIRPRLSIGVAAVAGNDVEAARAVADRRMYLNKRRRAQGATSDTDRQPLAG